MNVLPGSLPVESATCPRRGREDIHGSSLRRDPQALRHGDRLARREPCRRRAPPQGVLRLREEAAGADGAGSRLPHLLRSPPRQFRPRADRETGELGHPPPDPAHGAGAAARYAGGEAAEEAVRGPCAQRSVLPSEASPSVPLHFVEREGPEIGVVKIRQGGSSTFPLSTPWRGGQGVRPRRADRPTWQHLEGPEPL